MDALAVDTGQTSPDIEVVQPEPWRAETSAGVLVDAAAACAKAVPSSSVNPLLTQLELSSTPAGLQITGTDGEVLARRTVEAQANMPGAVLVGAKLFTRTLKELMGGRSKAAKAKPVELQVVEDCKLAVTVGGRTMTIAAMHEDTYPRPPRYDKRTQVTAIPAATLRRSLELVAFAGVKDSSTGATHYTNGCLVDFREGALHIVTTDGHRLARVKLDGFDLAEQVSMVEIRKSMRETTEHRVKQAAEYWDNYLAHLENARLADAEGLESKAERQREYAADNLKRCIGYEDMADLLKPGTAQSWYDSENERNYLMPDKVAHLLAKQLPKDEDAVVTLHYHKVDNSIPGYRSIDEYIAFAWDGALVHTKLLDVKFPPYERCIPKDEQARVHVIRQDLIDVLTPALTVARLEEQNPVADVATSSATGNEVLVVSVENRGGKYCEAIDCEAGGDSIDFSVNPAYIIDAAKALDGEQVTIGWTNAISPYTMTSPHEPEYLYLCMPIRRD